MSCDTCIITEVIITINIHVITLVLHIQICREDCLA